jgi:hypothetical protein
LLFRFRLFICKYPGPTGIARFSPEEFEIANSIGAQRQIRNNWSHHDPMCGNPLVAGPSLTAYSAAK